MICQFFFYYMGFFYFFQDFFRDEGEKSHSIAGKRKRKHKNERTAKFSQPIVCGWKPIVKEASFKRPGFNKLL